MGKVILVRFTAAPLTDRELAACRALAGTIRATKSNCMSVPVI